MSKDKVIYLDVNVYRRVFDAILEQRLTPGTRLNEEELARVFSVSRTVIRKALVRLAHDGIVESRKNKGTWLATMSPREARAILEARRLIEGAIIKLACDKITPEYVTELNNLILDEEKAEAAGNHGKALRLSGEFHFKISEIADNQPLADFSRKLVSKVSLIIAQFETPGSPGCILHDDHRALVEALGTGNHGLAEQLMYEHVNHIEAKISFDKVEEVISLRDIFNSE